jgi:putative membrane protein
MESHVAHAAERFQGKESIGSHFAWLNARLALEMTMMSWIRVAITLIGFGFTIVMFFERWNDMEGFAPAAQPFAARYIGLVLIGAGVAALAIAAVQYRATVRYLTKDDFAAVAGMGQAPGNAPVYAVTIGLMVIGAVAFVAVLVDAV